jgi:hypothetical protein
MIRNGQFREDLFYRLNVFQSKFRHFASAAKIYRCWFTTSLRASRGACKSGSHRFRSAPWRR